MFFCPDAFPYVRRCSWWVPEVEGLVGPSSQGGRIVFFLDALPCVRRCSWWVPAVRGANRCFLPGCTSLCAKMKLVGPSSQGCEPFFCPDALPCVRRRSWWVPAVKGKCFFREIWWHIRWIPAVKGKRFFSQNTGGPSDGSLLSGGGIIIFHVIRRHFLAAAVDPAVSLSTYSPHPMEVVPSPC